jgi:hypothetical protein
VSLVLDASLALAWYFEDEATAATDAVLGQLLGGLDCATREASDREQIREKGVCWALNQP